MDNISIIEVFISGRRIGRMALTPEGMCGFEYDADWIQTGFRHFAVDKNPAFGPDQRTGGRGNHGLVYGP